MNQTIATLVAVAMALLVWGYTTITVEKTEHGYIASYKTFWTTKHYEDVEIAKSPEGDVTVKFGKVDSIKSESKLLEKLVDRLPGPPVP